MAQQPLDCELITAIVTPFTADNRVDHPALERVAQHLIDTGSDGILVNGSTGESPTVSQVEKQEILKTIQGVIRGRKIKLIAGAGTNDTKHTVDLAREADEAGVDAPLVVVPYYNKPSQRGMLAHFSTVAAAVEAPVIIYNIPGRSIVNMQPETMAELAQRYDNIIGVKQSNADMDQVSGIRRDTPESFRIWCGDDSLTLPMMTLGAYGTFSVASHLTGQLIRDMIGAFKRRDLERALSLHLLQLEVFKDLFFLPNPTVVKTCLARMGLIEGYLRLPLLPPDEEEMRRIDKLLSQIQEIAPQPTPR